MTRLTSTVNKSEVRIGSMKESSEIISPEIMYCCVVFLKTRNDFWTEELEDAPPVKEKNGCGNDAKYLKRQAVIDLCRKYGVQNYTKRLLLYNHISFHLLFYILHSCYFCMQHFFFFFFSICNQSLLH